MATKHRPHPLVVELFELGKEQGITPAQVCARAGIGTANVYKLTNPNILTLGRLAFVIGYHLELAPGAYLPDKFGESNATQNQKIIG